MKIAFFIDYVALKKRLAQYVMSKPKYKYLLYILL